PVSLRTAGNRPSAYVQAVRQLHAAERAGTDDIRALDPGLLGHSGYDGSVDCDGRPGVPVRPRRYGPDAVLLQHGFPGAAGLRAVEGARAVPLPPGRDGVQSVQ